MLQLLWGVERGGGGAGGRVTTFPSLVVNTTLCSCFGGCEKDPVRNRKADNRLTFSILTTSTNAILMSSVELNNVFFRKTT